MSNAELRNTIIAIQGLLLNTSLEWHLEYEPQDNSYHIDIRKEEDPPTSDIGPNTEPLDTEPRKPIYQGYNSHDCETFYKCPWCDNTFGDWSLFNQADRPDVTKPYCPWCHKPLKEVK